MKTGSEMIAEERQRQIEIEGWTPEHDDEHKQGELAMAAICYASPKVPHYLVGDAPIDPWPSWWAPVWDKRQTTVCKRPIANEHLPLPERIRNLVKAGGLIAAEIDRLQRGESVKVP